MLRATVLILFCFLQTSVISQSLVRDSSEWAVLFENPFTGQARTITYRLSDEVEIEGKSYREIWSTNRPYYDEDPMYQPTNQYLREDDARRVFLRDQFNQEILLYDFSIEVGDTFLIDRSEFDSYMICTQIDSTELFNGDLRKRWTFNCWVGGVVEIYWIEGIGSPNYFIDVQNFCIIDGLAQNLLCKVENGQLVYSSPLALCHYETVSSESVADEEIKVSPNPFINRISVQAQSAAIYRIYNINGLIVLSGSTENAIYTDHLPDGMYFLEVVFHNGHSILKKMIKQSS